MEPRDERRLVAIRWQRSPFQLATPRAHDGDRIKPSISQMRANLGKRPKRVL